jgi:glycine cleavage system aminomethyltransferase T
LDAQRDAGGPARVLASLIWNEDDIAELFSAQFRSDPLPEPLEMPREIGPSLDRVLVGGRDVGASSGRTYSSVLRKMISLVGIDRDRAEPGADVTVLWGRPRTPQREIRAKVAALSLKPDRRRPDVSAL